MNENPDFIQFLERFKKQLSLFDTEPLNGIYQELFADYLSVYSLSSLNQLIGREFEKLSDAKQIEGALLPQVREEVLIFVRQLAPQLQKESEFHFYLCRELFNEKSDILMEPQRLFSRMKRLKTETIASAQELIQTIVTSTLENYRLIARPRESSGRKKTSCAQSSTNNERDLQLIQLQQDYDNLKKRTERERNEMKAQLSIELLGKLIPSLDQLNLALKHPPEEKESDFYRGIAMIYRQIYQTLSQEFGLESISCEGQLFDPNQHEAVAYEDSKKCKENIILRVISPGYKVGDKIIKYPKVTVARRGKKKK